MGCDIHMMIEYSPYKRSDGEPSWSSFGGDFNPGRDYTMFGYLAGVRGDGPPVVDLRGMPPGNKSYNGDQYYDNDNDLHSATWLTAAEYAQALAGRMFDPHNGGPPDVSYDVVLDVLNSFESRGTPARLLIAFDN